MSRIPILIQAELIGVPLYLHNRAREAQNSHERRIAVLEIGIWKAFVTLKSMQNIFADPAIATWCERLEKLLVYPGPEWNSARRLEVLEQETEDGIELLESSIRSSVLKQLRDFLIAARDGNICEYYQRISREEAGLIIEFSLETKDTPKPTKEGGPMN